MPSSNNLLIKVGARSSPLSRVQVIEIQTALQRIHPHIQFDAHYLSTIGDRDQATSLRFLGKTDFFTQDIDLLVLQKECRLGIHSAKDLPEPLTHGLKLFCLTQGVDPSDSLVLPPFMTLHSLSKGACIGTSSVRREEHIRNLRPDLTFKDIRGTIEQRLSQLERGEVDGVVIAEAALIRLGLTHLNRIRVPGATTAGQGQLGVVGRADDHEMEQLFACLDVRGSFQK